MGRGPGAIILASIGAVLVLGCSAAGDSGSSGRKPGASAGAGGTFGNAAGIAGGTITGGTGGSGGEIPGGIGQVVAPGEGAECAGVTQEAHTGPAPVDIIFALDNSGSMTFEATEVQGHMNAFAMGIIAAGIDVHVVIISDIGPPGFIMDPNQPPPPFPFPFPVPTGVSNGVCIGTPLGSGSCPDDTNLPGYLHVPVEVQSHDALFQLIMQFPNYQSSLRTTSLKYFAVVTDDESSMLADQFTQMVSTLAPGWFNSWKFFGVFCHPNECTVGFPEAPCVNPGVVYQQLVDQTGGIAGSLCQGQSDFKSVFDALAQTVVQNIELACEWAIPPVPMGETFAKNKVNVRYTPGGGAPEDIYWVETPAMCGDKGGWYYDDNTTPTKLQACAATCDRVKHDMAGKIEVRFGCLTIVRPD